jgi:hypothetical protein
MAGEIDRITAERALRRSLELAGGESRGLTADQLVAIGAELGVPEAQVRRAIAEVIAEGPRRRSIAPIHLRTSRVIELDAVALGALLDRWFTNADGLAVLRRPEPLVVTWEPRRGALAGARTAVERIAGADRVLRDARSIAAAVEPLSEGVSVVRLDATLTRDTVVTAAVIGGAGTVAAVVGGLVWEAPALLGVPVAVGVALTILAAHRRDARRVSVALERRLDALSRAEEPPKPLAGVGDLLDVFRRRKG